MQKNIKLREIEKKLREKKTYLEEVYKVKEIGVFGSFVRGEQKKRSDIDILVEFSEPVGLFKFMDLEEYLSSLLGVRVDLVSKKALKRKIGEIVLKETVFI